MSEVKIVWRPIKTLPSDGRYILYYPRDKSGQLPFISIVGFGSEEAIGHDGYPLQTGATYWAQLPPPPEETNE